jgi:hypothetical protein
VSSGARVLKGITKDHHGKDQEVGVKEQGNRKENKAFLEG